MMPTTGQIHDGCQFEEFFHPFIKEGKLTLVLNKSYADFLRLGDRRSDQFGPVELPIESPAVGTGDQPEQYRGNRPPAVPRAAGGIRRPGARADRSTGCSRYCWGTVTSILFWLIARANGWRLDW